MDRNADDLHLEICGCMRHAHIVSGTEEVTGELFSQEEARAAVDEFFEDFVITQETRDQLYAEIWQSGLPEEISPEMRSRLDLDERIDQLAESLSTDGPHSGLFDQSEYLDDIHQVLGTFPPEKRILQ